METQMPWFCGEAGIDAYLRQDNYLILDWECTNLQYGSASNPKNRLVLGCWRVVKNGAVTDKFIFGDEYDYQELLDDIAAADFLIAHNAQFELAWLSRCGLDLRSVLCYCTLVGEWVIAGNRRVQLGLEECADKYKLGRKGSLVSKLIDLGTCPSEIPESWLLEYCQMDVELCHKVFLAQQSQIANLDLWHIILSRNLTIPVLADIHLAGQQLDKEAVIEEEARLQAIIEELGEELDTITGGINLGSPKQLGAFLYKELGFAPLKDRKGNVIKTPGGSLPTSQDILFQLKPNNEKQERFLALYKEYNKADTLLSKSMSFFKQVVLDKELKGTYHSLIIHGRTQTHRLASAGIDYTFAGNKKSMKVQAQNLPREYKKLFVAHDPDYVVLEADGAGMEFRVAVLLGHDTQGRDDIVSGADIHGYTRDVINEFNEENAFEERIDRQTAKASTFTPLFWGRGDNPAEQAYAIDFAKKYSGIRKAQEDWTITVADKKYLETPYGFRYYWPTCKVTRSGWIEYTNQIVNAPIQGLATAEIIPVALVHFWHKTKGMPIEIFNTVHDSIASRVHKDFVDIAKQLSKEAMTTDVYKFFKDVYRYTLWEELPLGVGLKVGKAWGVSDCEEIFECWQSGRERYTVERNKKKEIIYDRPNGEMN